MHGAASSWILLAGGSAVDEGQRPGEGPRAKSSPVSARARQAEKAKQPPISANAATATTLVIRCPRPSWVMIVDDEGVNMPQGPMPVGTPVRLRSLPAFMLVLVMLVMNMQVIVVSRIMRVRDLDRIGLWPKGHGEPACKENNTEHDGEGR